ncbi:DUF1150 family protein [Oceanicella actignis]|uniref:DUF1150 family protein n=1 Tax=Oceanicella actignis TaxID=1189325 RepID=A0A1M7TEE4_9RHOB|nr:DUF1150 family protein [Oceanicella actignis]TYO88598.1 uncharacterized protein DUF1150 [Oceanicella actignis]SET62591.1 Protein of unknown function [Oceanicella actignis]SHN69041.1 Protein of unknown function [Oceanicella actignis]
MPKQPFFIEGLGPDDKRIVYVRELRQDELPPEAVASGNSRIYAIHDAASGARLALTDDCKLAFKLARQHDRKPVHVH